eukprot:jgi/Galph1/3892/GphlegSOOS_G2530.1
MGWTSCKQQLCPLALTLKKLSNRLRSLSTLRNGLDENEEYTHFGFRSVPKNKKTSMVGSVFSDVAEKYDIMNDLMSFGIHRLWKDSFVQCLGPTPDMRVLDVAGGTGDIAFRIVEKKRQQLKSRRDNDIEVEPVVVVDINENMLRVGRTRAKERGYGEKEVVFVQGNAEKLPASSETVDAYTISFGMRNVTRPEAALAEAYRVLRPGGRFLMLEFGKVENQLFHSIYDWYSFYMIPLIGQLVTNNRDAYQYLIESIRQFPSQEEFVKLMAKAGFQEISYSNFNQGIACQYSGFKLI